MRTISVSGVVAGMLAAAAASAQPRPPAEKRGPPSTVAELARVCAVPPRAAEYTAATYFCRGFLAGVGQYHAALNPSGGRNRPVFCVPDPPPRLVDVGAAFVTWAQANPQHGTDAAVDGLARFAQQAYPCPSLPARAMPPHGGGGR